MVLYFADRKCAGTFCLNVCRGNVMKDVSAAIVLSQSAVASGPPWVPCVLCGLLEAGDICVHGPGIPGPGGEKPRWVPRAARPASSLLASRVGVDSRSGEFTLFYMAKTHTRKYTHKRESYCDLSAAWASATLRDPGRPPDA